LIVSPGAFLRAGGLILAAVVLQLSGVAGGRFFGATIDLIPLVVAAVAIYAGSVSGAATGFTTGLLLDLATGQTVGAASLVLTAVGYGVGRFRELRDPAHGLMPIPVGAAATAGWVLAYGAVSFMLDIGTDVTMSPVIFRDMITTVAINSILAIPVFAIARRVLRPSLAVDPYDVRRRRQPPRETGPLGLRGLEV
jgi:rod shape-determining protein MreD